MCVDRMPVLYNLLVHYFIVPCVCFAAFMRNKEYYNILSTLPFDRDGTLNVCDNMFEATVVGLHGELG